MAPGESLSDTLAERDILMVRRTIYADLAKAASVVQERTSRSKVKFKGSVSVHDMQKRVDDLSRAYREADSIIQEMNWKTELEDGIGGIAVLLVIIFAKASAARQLG